MRRNFRKVRVFATGARGCYFALVARVWKNGLMRCLLVLFGAMTGLVGCGDSIDCDWFAGPNCWKESVAAAQQCTTGGERPALSADRKTCTYLDGTEVRLAEPLPEVGGLSEYDWDFEIVKDGTTCAAFQESEGSSSSTITLTTSLGVFRERVGGSKLEIDCPMGGSFEISVFDVFECDFSQLPGTATTPTSFSLLGSSEPLFACAE